MSTTSTPNLGLVKPTLGTGEHADVSVINGNMDKIDAAVGDLGNKGSLQDQIDAINEFTSQFNLTNATRISFRTIQGGVRIMIWNGAAELYLLDIAQTSTLKKSTDAGQTYTTIKTW